MPSRLAHTQRRGRSAAGFTLVELLVVIVIIGILASLITAAAIGAINRAKQVALMAEMADLQRGLELVKTHFGAYPPDWTDRAAMGPYLRRAYPKARGWLSKPNWLLNNPEMNPSTALVFWLGGCPGETGFADDSASWYYSPSKCATRVGPFVEFDKKRINPLSNAWIREYLPKIDDWQNSHPYVYFRAEKTTGYAGKVCTITVDGNTVEVRPFQKPDGTWINPNGYQLLCPGMDGRYGQTSDGAPPVFPDGGNYTSPMYDDITSFSEGTLEDALPF
jgi:prepilin-type N-terminal cleavage/methylation domain-containing protein